MKFNNKIISFVFISILINCGIFIPSNLFYRINSYRNAQNLMNTKIMFDPSLFSTTNNRIIVNFKEGTNLIDEKQNLLDICKLSSDPILYDYISSMVCEVDSDEILKIISMDSVQKIFLDEKVELVRPDDEKSISYENIFQLNQCANTVNSRAIPFTGSGINISIIDTGIDFTHSDLSGKIIDEVSFVTEAYGFDEERVEGVNDLNGHGTHCAGIATGTGTSSPSGYNLTGIAPNAKLLNAKCLDKFGAGYLSGVMGAIEWSIDRGASIISMSLGFSTSDPDHPICRLVDNATKQGVVVVASAGNSGPFYSTTGSPASARYIITVGATNKDNKISEFSSRGPTALGYIDPDVVAPGEDVLSVAAGSSVLGKIMQLNNEYINGKNGNNYMVLSGTSMSCPMVAGSAALLLEAFPTLNPYMIRIALMKGANSLGYSPNVEGAGLIDLNESYNYLSKFSPLFNVSSVFPKMIPNPPLEFSMFPGDQYTDDLIILSGKKTNISVNCIGNISEFISFEKTTSNEIIINESFLYIKSNDSYYTNLNINFDFPISIEPSLYEGIIEIRNNDTNKLLEVVNISFEITLPRARIYFDCFHNADSADHVRSNYYNFTKMLSENAIDINFGESLLLFPLLSQYDLIILPDMETPLTDRELTALKRYWQNNNTGNILTLSNYYPSTAIETYNEIFSTLEIDINYTKNNIEYSYDTGFMKEYDDFLITDISEHPITENVSKFSWLTGVAIETHSSDVISLASYDNKPVLVAQNTSNNHKIVSMGSERLFYDDFISRSYNRKLVSQCISWLLNNTPKSNSEELRVEVVVNESIMELGNNNNTEIGFYVVNPQDNSSIGNLIPHKNLSSFIYHYDGGWNNVWIGNSSDIVDSGGAYHFNFSTNLTGLFLVNITIENLTSIGNGIGYTFFNTSISMPSIINYSLETSKNEDISEYDAEISNDIFRNSDSIIINITLHDNDLISDIQNVTAYITPLDVYRSDIKYLQIEMPNTSTKDALKTNYSLIISPDYSYPAGSYVVFVEVIDSSGNSDYSSAIFEFNINNKYPEIDAKKSKLNGLTFEQYQSGIPAFLIAGFNFNVDITGTDIESDLSEMHAYVAIFSYFTIGRYSYLYEILWGTEVPFIGSSFSGAVSLPISGVSEILDESYSVTGSNILLILLHDGDGEYDDDSYTYALVSVAPYSTFFTIIMVIIIVIITVAAIVSYIYLNKRKGKQKTTVKTIICPKCGSKVKEIQRYCPNCGYHVSMNELDSDKLDFE
ncbi:MAG: S8 family serine peptidase [Candidatus Lokiarchaeota archaeon]|nr:S8 family serine peptidase [Candidatus Lokiarchaeota archaeon]